MFFENKLNRLNLEELYKKKYIKKYYIMNKFYWFVNFFIIYSRLFTRISIINQILIKYFKYYKYKNFFSHSCGIYKNFALKWDSSFA